MQSAEQDRKYVTLTEALSWIAFRTLLDATDIKERLHSDPGCQATLEKAARQFSVAAGDGRLMARGRCMTDADESRHPNAGHTDDIHPNRFRDFQQFELDRERLQHLPAKGSRVIGTWGVPTTACAPDGVVRAVTGWMDSAEEAYARAFQSYAGDLSDEGASLGSGLVGVEVHQDDLLHEFPALQPQQRLASHEEVVAWCRQKIASGTTDMNAAWKDFQSSPQFARHSRDNVFRPAWNDAKTKS